MINQNAKNENPEMQIQCEFGDSIRELQISKLLKQSNIKGKSGKSFYEVFQFLLLLVFQNCNLFHFLNSKKQDTAFSKNTYYRFLNNTSFNWSKFITLLSAKVIAYFDTLTRPERVMCLVLDDSVVPRERSKKVELLSYVFNHVIGKTVKGFNMLTVGWTDGFSFIPVGFNMMASAKSEKRVVEANSSIDKRSNGFKSRRNAVISKPEAAIKLIQNALNAGVKASYVLMDTWFTNEPFIDKVLALGVDVIGMLKDNKQFYFYKGHKCNLKQLGKLVSFSKPGNILYSICVETGKQRIPVKLVFVRNRNKRSEYIVILSTDCGMSNEEIIRTYGNRWSIELFFRAGKSLLDLGTEFQGLSYDMTVSSTAIVYTRYILLEWMRRKKNDDKTICELFYVCCDDIQDMELTTALKQLLELLVNGLQNRAITITNEVKSQLINWFVSQPLFIQALCPNFGWEV
ncbi:MAG TPA: transposase [Lachnospiraceae bacterium]|mgnify:FL=1|jgi:hypothetical protein|nr:transposase [Lachnospiraceae bacterium]